MLALEPDGVVPSPFKFAFSSHGIGYDGLWLGLYRAVTTRGLAASGNEISQVQLDTSSAVVQPADE